MNFLAYEICNNNDTKCVEPVDRLMIYSDLLSRLVNSHERLNWTSDPTLVYRGNRGVCMSE